MADLTPVSSLAGGVLIGASASILLLFEGRIAGVSGILANTLASPARSLRWRVPFLLGLALVGLAARSSTLAVAPAASPVVLVVAGLLVGFGARLGNGCTSGHGIAGLSRLSPRSLAATLTFIAVGMLTTFVIRHVGWSR